ncbi:uncharacterized protein SPAPADRAFT_49477 [Spathaspora passalidarum NRRL Y-27907]|uniref:Membrane magnesium transporter n=1 Tax=Spathaspora passalidarum (strain NRRL Y-27907 / 11-Y1) TaxID=619300 RepID=G3AIG4_SPAPN|nr:uncharacterized protein SPAPADRAFT_49477 [Spathaspora passalidarum NRRL Y-27907]EGW34434.1 hypothetical protein SPAPADRAFT_49477 [Spathaspora passalidarum NRRL Y-27907]
MLFYAIGILLLTHAGYSAFEHHKLASHTIHSALPLDIIVETIVATVIIVFGSITSIKNSPALTLDNEVVTMDSQYLKPIRATDASQLDQIVGVSEYDRFDNRIEFVDVIAKRREYAEWIKEQE